MTPYSQTTRKQPENQKLKKKTPGHSRIVPGPKPARPRTHLDPARLGHEPNAVDVVLFPDKLLRRHHEPVEPRHDSEGRRYADAETPDVGEQRRKAWGEARGI